MSISISKNRENQPWTPFETGCIITGYNAGIGPTQLALTMSRSPVAIQKQAKKLGVTLNKSLDESNLTL